MSLSALLTGYRVCDLAAVDLPVSSEGSPLTVADVMALAKG